MKQLNILFLALVLLVGCANLAAPQGLDQQLAYGYASYAAVLDTTADLVERGRLPKADGANILAQAKTARVSLETARSLVGQGKPNDAIGYLQSAQSILSALEAKLKESQ